MTPLPGCERKTSGNRTRSRARDTRATDDAHQEGLSIMSRSGEAGPGLSQGNRAASPDVCHLRRFSRGPAWRTERTCTISGIADAEAVRNWSAVTFALQSFGQTEHSTISVCAYPGLKSRCGSLEQMGAKVYGDLAQPAEIPICCAVVDRTSGLVERD